MHCMTVLYPNREGAKFDFEYYMQKHIPLANGLLGHEFKVSRGVLSAQGGLPAFLCIARMDIGTVADFLPVLGRRVEALGNDIPNYTNVEPVIQFEEVLLTDRG
jgi:uncharacterized protein (TIGR02118 family)